MNYESEVNHKQGWSGKLAVRNVVRCKRGWSREVHLEEHRQEQVRLEREARLRRELEQQSLCEWQASLEWNARHEKRHQLQARFSKWDACLEYEERRHEN